MPIYNIQWRDGLVDTLGDNSEVFNVYMYVAHNISDTSLCVGTNLPESIESSDGQLISQYSIICGPPFSPITSVESLSLSEYEHDTCTNTGNS